MRTLLLLLLVLVVAVKGEPTCTPVPGTPPNVPLGVCKGLKPGRVVWAHSPDACTWNGTLGTGNFWWLEPNLDSTTVGAMVKRTLVTLSGVNVGSATTPADTAVAAAWDALFRDANARLYGETNRGYRSGDGIAIKLNLNGAMGRYDNNNGNGVSPQFLRALIETLVTAAVPQDAIFVYDASRWFLDSLWDAVHAAFPRVHCVDNAGLNGREKAQPDMASHLQFSNASVPAWNTTYLPTIATAARYIIAVDAFRGHTYAGVTLTGKQWFGSIWRPDSDCWEAGHWCPRSLHPFVVVHDADGMPGNPMGSYTPLVDLLGHPDLAGKGVVFLADGLYGGPQEDGGMPHDPREPTRFVSAPFNGAWSCSIFGSQDPVALDSVLFDFLRNEPNVPLAHSGCVDNYLHEAALVPTPSSGTSYNPTGNAPLKESLGCHEHWDSAATKRYSRNLGRSYGIELVRI